MSFRQALYWSYIWNKINRINIWTLFFCKKPYHDTWHEPHNKGKGCLINNGRETTSQHEVDQSDFNVLHHMNQPWLWNKTHFEYDEITKLQLLVTVVSGHPILPKQVLSHWSRRTMCWMCTSQATHHQVWAKTDVISYEQAWGWLGTTLGLTWVEFGPFWT